MSEFHFLQNILLILGISIPVIIIFNKFRLPSIVGFIITGIIFGPFGLKLIDQSEGIKLLAEIGVAFLLFTIGIEISFSRFSKFLKEILITGGAQVVFTIVAGAFVSSFYGLKINQAIFIGFLLAHSSSAVLLKLLHDRQETDSPYGKISVGITLFQDIMIVPMILVVPLLSVGEGMRLFDVVPQLLVSFGIIALIFISAKFLIPRIIFTLVNLKMRDAFLIGIIFISLGSAWLTYSMGFSFAIGAFLAGLILSETEYTHQITSDVYPFKDIFTSLFFVSFGMLLDISFVLNNPETVISYTILIIILKLTVVFTIIYLLKYPVRISAMVAISLAQIGEFSFVLASIGMKHELLSQDLYKGFIAASLTTLLITPILVSFAPRLTSRLPELFKRKRLDSTLDSTNKFQNHVIIVGYGLNGHNLAKVLKETGINYIVIELNPKTVKVAKAQNEKIIFGDASKLKILESANINKAKIIVFAISDPIAIRRCIQSARQLNPNIHIIVRTRYVSEIDDLLALGANDVIPEEFETSIQIFSRVLKKYHIPNSVILAQSNVIRNQSYGVLRDIRFSDVAFEQINQILAQGTIDTVFIGHNNANIGKSLKEINLKALTGATVITVIRNNESIHNPSGSLVIQENDQLILFGTHEAIDNADELLITEN